MFIKWLVTPCSAVGFPHLLYKPSKRIWNIKQMKYFGCKQKKYWPCHIIRNLQSLLPPLSHQNLSISLKTLSILSIKYSNDWQPLIWDHLGSTYHVKTYWPKKWDQNINQSFPKKTCLLLGKVLGLSSTSFGDDPFISVFPIQFCLLTEIMSHIHLFRACLVSLLKQICVQIDFQRFRQIQESNSKYQSVSRELVVHSMHCTQFNCFQYFINFPSIPSNLSSSPISAATHTCHFICTHVFWCQETFAQKCFFLRQYFLAA